MPLMFDYEFKFGEVERVDTVIFGIDEGSPLASEEIDVAPGDAIVSIDSIPVNSVEDVRNAVAGKEGGEVPVVVKDLQGDGSERELMLAPYTEEGSPARLGVFLGTSAQINYSTPVQKVFSGFMHSYNVFAYSMDTLGKIVGFSVSQRSAEPLAETVSGPIGIYSIVQTIVVSSASDTVLTLMDLTALISISLAFINILPLPALDGGRVVFVLLEVFRGEPVSPKLEASVHKAGILVLLSLLILVTIRDVSRIFLN
jgi:regulator of sigma E protease